MACLLKKIVSTHNGVLYSLLRVLVGFVFLKAGIGKLYEFGLYPIIGKVIALEGFGFKATVEIFKGLNLPDFVSVETHVYLAAYTEMIGGGLLIVGLFSRLVALPLVFVMVVALTKAHGLLSDNPSGHYYPMLILFCCLTFVEKGSGLLSVDKVLSLFQKRESSSSDRKESV